MDLLRTSIFNEKHQVNAMWMLIFLLTSVATISLASARVVPTITPEIRSDFIVTKFGPDIDTATDENKPGWVVSITKNRFEKLKDLLYVIVEHILSCRGGRC